MRKLSAWLLVPAAALFLRAQLVPPAGGTVKTTPALRRAMAAPSSPAGTVPVWVYFKDKGRADAVTIRRSLLEIRRAFPDKALARRAKARRGGPLFDFEDLPLDQGYAALVRPFAARVRVESRWLNALSVEASPESIRALEGLPCVGSLDLVRGFRREEPRETSRTGIQAPALALGPFQPRLPVYGPSWRQIELINAAPLHLAGYTGQGVLVALFDVGFRKSHEAFRSARLVAEHDFVFGDANVQRDLNNPNDYSDAHGTATWSLLGAFSPGRIIGPAFGASFVLAKTEDERSETPIEEDYWAAAMEWAEGLGVDLVSSSLGYTDWYTFKDMDGKTAVTTRAANRATSLGVVVVNAAGNDRGDAWGHIIAPADGVDVIAVGAVDANRRLASFSSPGPTADGRIKPEVCAMGVRTIVAASTPTSGDALYEWGSGTSYSTPQVAGAAALLLEIHPDWTVAQVRSALMSTASRASAPNNDYGWGIINAAAASKK